MPGKSKHTGVIETTEAVLGDTVLAQQFQFEIRALHQAGITICHRLLTMEGRVQELSDSFTRYKNVERTSKLIGIAVQLIPIAGGAAAGALSAGAEIIDGLSVKDVTDYAPGLAQVSDDDVMTFTDRLFGRARKKIAPETIDTLSKTKRRKLEEVMHSSGYGIEVLRIMFQDPSCEVVGTKATSLLEGSTSSFQDEEVSVDTDQNGVVSSAPAEEESQEGTFARCNSQEESKRVEFKCPELNREVISRSTPEDLARLWTGFILQSKEETAEFLEFSLCIRDGLLGNHISGSLLATRNTVEPEEVIKMVVEDLQKKPEINLTLGRLGWARKFIFVVYEACHGLSKTFSWF